MGRKTKSSRPRGRPSRLPEEQTKFLSSFWSGWDDARAENDRGVVSSFYNNVATAFLEKFGPPGIKLPAEESDISGSLTTEAQGSGGAVSSEFDINVLDPQLRDVGPSITATSHSPASALPPVTQGQLSFSNTPVPSSSEDPQSDWSKTRSVCVYPFFLYASNRYLQFVVGWFNHHGKKNTKTENRDAGMALLNAITNMTLKRPIKPAVLIAYQREHYATRIQEDFEKQWAVSCAEWKEALKTGRTEGCEEPVKVKIRTQVARAAWNRETQEFRDSFTRSLEGQHGATLEVFERKNVLPETPEDYAK